jgi:hypothetical protein
VGGGALSRVDGSADGRLDEKASLQRSPMMGCKG